MVEVPQKCMQGSLLCKCERLETGSMVHCAAKHAVVRTPLSTLRLILPSMPCRAKCKPVPALPRHHGKPHAGLASSSQGAAPAAGWQHAVGSACLCKCEHAFHDAARCERCMHGVGSTRC